MADGICAEISGTKPSTQKQQQIIAENKAAYYSLCHKAMLECFNLSTLMYEKLPEEIRNMVYYYLCDDRQIPLGPYYHFRKYEPLKGCEEVVTEESSVDMSSEERYFERCLSSPTDGQIVLPDGRIKTYHDIYPPSDFIMPEKSHTFMPNYMGKEVALEALKSYYEINSFSVCNVVGGLDSLCTNVAPGVKESTTKIVPIDHICNLQIRVKCEHFDIPALPLNTFGPASSPHARIEQFAQEEIFLRGTVESLAKFRSKIQTSTPHELNVEIVLMSNLKSCTNDEYMQARIVNFLQTIRNFVYELMYDREKTTVRVTHQDDGLMAFPKNYTGLFQLTKDQWDYEKSKQQPDHDWTHDFWIRPIEGDELPDVNLSKLGGYCVNTLGTFLHERWGIHSILHKTISNSPVMQGFAWPVGYPYRPEVVKELIGRPL